MRRAFTLIELIIVVLLLSIMLSFIVTVFAVGLKAWSSGHDRAVIRQGAVLAVERMVRDLSMAGNITVATSNSITFSADVDDDSINETVSFDLSGNNLTRTVNGAASTLAPDVQTLALSYTDPDNLSFTPATQGDRNNIRVITASLTMNKSGETFNLSSSAYARNQTS